MCCRVVGPPAQFSVLPPDDEVQGGAVALQYAVCDFLDGDRLVVVVCETVSGKLGPVEPSGLVKAPVFQNAQCGGVVPLGPCVDAGCALRSHIQHEVGRLALCKRRPALGV